MHVATGSAITLFYTIHPCSYMKSFGHVGNIKKVYMKKQMITVHSIAVTDNLFVRSAFTTCNKNTFKLLS